MEIRNYIRKVIEESFSSKMLNEALWQQRLDNAFDRIKKYNIKIGKEAIEKYVSWNKENIENVEKYIYSIKENGYLYSSDTPLFYVASMSDLKSGEIDSGESEVNILRFKIKTLEYKYTHVYNTPWEGVRDKYRLIIVSERGHETVEELTGEEIIDLYNGKVVGTEHGDFATTPEAIELYLREEGIIEETESFSDDYDLSKHNFNHGDCDIYAVSLHRLYGYPLYVVRGWFLEPEWGGEREWDHEDSHMVVKLPNGYYMDSNGETTEAELRQNCAFSNDISKITFEHLSEEEALGTFSCENQEPAIKQVMRYIKSKKSS